MSLLVFDMCHYLRKMLVVLLNSFVRSSGYKQKYKYDFKNYVGSIFPNTEVIVKNYVVKLSSLIMFTTIS